MSRGPGQDGSRRLRAAPDPGEGPAAPAARDPGEDPAASALPAPPEDGPSAGRPHRPAPGAGDAPLPPPERHRLPHAVTPTGKERLPPGRSSPPPSPGAHWRIDDGARPRAARRAAAEARDPAPPRAQSPVRAKRPRAPSPARPAPAPARDVAPPASRGPRRIAEPRAARVRADDHGRPLTVAGKAVEAVRESWLVEDRWWTDAPLRRRYWEVVTADGRNRVVFRDLVDGGWFTQRG